MKGLTRRGKEIEKCPPKARIGPGGTLKRSGVAVGRHTSFKQRWWV